MIRTIVAIGVMAVVACAVRPTPEEVTGSSSTGAADGGEASGVPTTSGGSTGPQAGTDTTDATSTTGGATEGSTGPGGTTESDTCGFICGMTTGDEDVRCDVMTQNCPEGEKCSAYANPRYSSDSWNDAKCVPVQGEGQPGDSCTAPGMGLSGFDDCAKGARCWDVDEMDQGVCVALCTGSEADPKCEQGFACTLCSDCVLNLCLPSCDPLSQDCADGDLCLPINTFFVCVVDDSGEEGQVFDPCEFANACDKGLLCLNPTAATECDVNAGGCCIPMCDVSDPDFVCPGVGIECVSLYEVGMAPPEFEKVGICVLPG